MGPEAQPQGLAAVPTRNLLSLSVHGATRMEGTHGLPVHCPGTGADTKAQASLASHLPLCTNRDLTQWGCLRPSLLMAQSSWASRCRTPSATQDDDREPLQLHVPSPAATCVRIGGQALGNSAGLQSREGGLSDAGGLSPHPVWVVGLGLASGGLGVRQVFLQKPSCRRQNKDSRLRPDCEGV